MHRKALAVVLLGLLLLAAPATASSAPSRNAQAGCTIVNEGQTRTLVGQLTEDRYTEYYTSGGQPQTKNHKISRFSMGNLAIRAATCRAKGRWRVIDPLTVTPSYANMNADGTVPFGATSWGLAPFRVKDRKLVIRSVWCKTSRVWSGVKGLLGVPIPGPFALAVGQYVAQQGGVTFLPDDKTRCKKIVKLVVPFRFGPHGELSLGAVGGQRTYFISDYGDFTLKKDLRVAVRQG